MSRLFSSLALRVRFLGSLLAASIVILVLSSTTKVKSHLSYPELAGDAAFKLAISYHHLQDNGINIAYRTSAGYLAIRDKQNKPLANIFYTAYEKDGDNTERPITFVFNGGPGSSSIWLHLGALGPNIVDAGKNDYKQNPNSWLGFTDMVFIDPVGTGYSQPAPGIDVHHFYNYQQDISSIAEFIRTYLTEHHRLESPKFLTGESYGGVRAVGLAAFLQDSLQIKLNGITLISPALNYKLISFRQGNNLPYSYYLPAYAIAAQNHKLLSPELQQLSPEQLTAKVSRFSFGVYASFLKTHEHISSQLIDTLSYFTGLSKRLLRQTNGRVTDKQFTRSLLYATKKVTGTFDSRATGTENNADPSETAIRTLFARSFKQYVTTGLNYENHLPYQITASTTGWNYGPEAASGYLDVSGLLKKVILKNPDLKIKIACGYYDLATPISTTDYVIKNLGLPASLKRNISTDYYHAGHMIYLSEGANIKFRSNSETFYSQSLTPAKS